MTAVTAEGHPDSTPAIGRAGVGLAPGGAPWTYWDIAKATGAIIALTIVASLVAAAIASPLLGPDEEFQDDALAYAIVLVPTMIVVELLFLGAAFWFGPRKYHLPFRALGLREAAPVSWPLAGAVALASLAVVFGYEAALSVLGAETESTPGEVFDRAGPFLVVAVGAVVLAPVMEEIFFRGFIMTSIWQRRGWVLAAGASSLVFAIAHLSLLGFPAYAAIGMLMAWLYQRSGSIKSSIAAHAMVNSVTLGVGLVASL